MRSQLSQYFMKSLEYEEKETICGENRNSYYKTDHDATAMCLKDDYYSGLGSNMHAAYNTQILVSNGFIVSYYVSQDRSDTRTLANAIGILRNCVQMPATEALAIMSTANRKVSRPS